MKYEKWSLGYWFLKQYIKFADWLIHKRIIISGKEKIPRNKPIVFAPNHQNALSDPMAVLLHTRFQPVWLARADIFGKSKVVDAILKFMKIIPVYRLRDGKENLEKNEQTFADSITVLEHNFALALFPEAAHSAKKRCRALFLWPKKKRTINWIFKLFPPEFTTATTGNLTER
jgi:1-acyl-sn-glycerol-3-phosphate acyltransferase